MSDGGKGDSPRPLSVERDKFYEKFLKTFSQTTGSNDEKPKR